MLGPQPLGKQVRLPWGFCDCRCFKSRSLGVITYMSLVTRTMNSVAFVMLEPQYIFSSALRNSNMIIPFLCFSVVSIPSPLI